MAVVFSDTFTAENGTTLQAHDATWVKNTADAPVDLIVQSGGVVLSSGTTASAYINTTAGSLTDQLVEADIFSASGTGGIHGVVARSAPSAREYYIARWNGGYLQLYRFAAGSVLQLGGDVTASVTVGQTHRIGLRCVGNQISLEWDGVTKIGPITDSTYASGYPGVRVLTDASRSMSIDNFSVDNLGASPSPPTGTVTIGTITPGTTSASVAYSYSAGDATGFEYRIGGGPAASIGASPATISGLTAGTPYSIEVRAINASGPGTWSAVANFNTEAEGPGNLPPSFDGPSIAAISATEGVALSALDVSSRFSDAESALTFSAVGSWPAGVTVSSAGVISGTPTAAGTYASLQVRATDAGSLTADSNTFSITVAAAALPSTITVTEPLKNNTGTVLANVSGVRVAVLEAATLAGVFETSGLTTNASGILATISDAAIITGQQYHVAIKLADGSVGITGPITAS